MSQVLIYTTDICPYCHQAKELLTARGVAFEEIRIDLDPQKRDEMMSLSQKRTVPQIFINQKSIGGYDDLVTLIKTGEFDKLINRS
jgi:glutaredoxin 3